MFARVAHGCLRRRTGHSKQMSDCIKVHQVLEEYGKLVPPAKQVQDLIDGIDCSKRMMVAALPTLPSTNNRCEDFQEATGYLCNFIAANKNENTTRIFSGADSGVQSGTGNWEIDSIVSGGKNGGHERHLLHRQIYIITWFPWTTDTKWLERPRTSWSKAIVTK